MTRPNLLTVARTSLAIVLMGSVFLVRCYELQSSACGEVVCPIGFQCTQDGKGCVKNGSRCGDGTLDQEEDCDDGNVEEDLTCPHDCRRKQCGNGRRESDEHCDSGGVNTKLCDQDCTAPRCGDGLINEAFIGPSGKGEECDPGQLDELGEPKNTYACNKDCTNAHCGDGNFNPMSIVPADGAVREHFEECDLGQAQNTGSYGAVEGCTADCRRPAFCGDGNVDKGEGETCDPNASKDRWDAEPARECRQDTCTRCGDGITQEGEQCDLGNATSECTAHCTLSTCGDHYTNIIASEDCDDGPLGSPTCNGADAVKLGCRKTTCGDGYANAVGDAEQCDTGGDSADCNGDCTRRRCGDGYVNTAGDHQGRIEECDPGKNADIDGNSSTCTKNCIKSVCGDAIVNLAANEGCDPGRDENCNPVTCQWANCGNGVLDLGEQCDPGAPLIPEGPVIPSATCDIDCTEAVCGDRQVNPNTEIPEQCDDGNDTPGDGCSGSCQPEPGFRCQDAGKHCETVCGDGQVKGNERCDNDVADPPGAPPKKGDGCSDTCAPELGYICKGTDPSHCVPECGDGQLVGEETCDDGNTNSGDGCSADSDPPLCTIEPDYECAILGGKSQCKPTCGDGKRIANEACDDGNADSGDGCSESCTQEAGFLCEDPPPYGPEPDRCLVTCGKGFDASCLDGNKLSGDGCAKDCTVEWGYRCSLQESFYICTRICASNMVWTGTGCIYDTYIRPENGDST